jgi:hypothetical protein
MTGQPVCLWRHMCSEAHPLRRDVRRNFVCKALTAICVHTLDVCAVCDDDVRLSNCAANALWGRTVKEVTPVLDCDGCVFPFYSCNKIVHATILWMDCFADLQ